MNIVDALIFVSRDISEAIWYCRRRRFIKEVAPLIIFWSDRFFLNWQNLQELGKERHLLLKESDLERYRHYFYKKQFQKLQPSMEDLTAPLTIKVHKKIKGTWLFLYTDAKGIVHDFYFSNTKNFEAPRAFFNHSLASNGLPQLVNLQIANNKRLAEKLNVKSHLDDMDFI